jgi:Biopolymer transport protein
MTPFVDIVLVILIIFMATPTFMVEGKIPVNLPKAKTSERTTVSTKPVVVAIKKDGTILIDNNVISGNLESALSKVANKDSTIVLQASKDTPFQNVVSVIDACRELGINKYMIETKKE